jgi:hypothetical protein
LTEKANENDLKKFLKGTKDKYRFFRQKELKERAFKENYTEGDDLLRNVKKRRDIFVRILKEKRTKNFDPGDHADVLCMYGEFIEEVGKKKYKKSAKYFAPESQKKLRIKHESYRKQEPYTSFDSYRKARRKPRVSMDWKDADGQVVEFFKKGDRAEDEITGKHRRIRAFRTSVGKDQRRALLEKYKPLLAGGKYPGGALFQLDHASSIKQIDRMFGLMKMADISGTTADTVFGMEVLWHHFHAGTFKSGPGWTDNQIADWLEDALRMKEVLYLLPLVSMTYQAHHSLLECAFTLSLNDYIDYSVGVYSSLRPQYWKDQEYEVETGKAKMVKKGIAKWAEPKTPQFKRAVKDLEKILKEHETIEQNHPLLCYFDDPKAKPTGVFLFNKKSEIERKVFDKCANIKRNMKNIGESNEGNIAGWASVLYSEDLQKRYPGQNLVIDTILCAAFAMGHWVDVDEYPKIALKGKPDCTYKMTPIKKGELRVEERSPEGLGELLEEGVLDDF